MNDKLKATMARVYNFDVVTTSDSDALNCLKSSGSLKMMTFIASVEEAFDISFSDEEIIAMLDIESIESILMKHMEGKLDEVCYE